MTKKKQELEPKVTRPRSTPNKVVIDNKATLAAKSKTAKVSSKPMLSPIGETPVKSEKPQAETKPIRPTCPVCNGPTVSAYLDKGKLREIILCNTPTCENYRKYIKGN